MELLLKLLYVSLCPALLLYAGLWPFLIGFACYLGNQKPCVIASIIQHAD